jgi:hypothetical protein
LGTKKQRKRKTLKIKKKKGTTFKGVQQHEF